jgi:hypothetical protein
VASDTRWNHSLRRLAQGERVAIQACSSTPRQTLMFTMTPWLSP